ncbi:TetR/AcrR family transcriptional regulator C-terminal ligand-binding domain-containing protein [Streptomyces sp. NBC_00656]|uniref:TetR/AcrR family transcriptional regulator n=1 Tax=Streptomyces sp. NBC_00656 TaxID=2903668 RepID=UPI00324E16A7
MGHVDEPHEPHEPPKGPERRGRGRRPAAEVRQAVLETAGAMLFEAGLPGITFEKVATRAGASKMTLYKWWPSPGALAFEAYFTAVEDTLAFADTGDIERDLTAQLHSFVGLLTGRPAGPVIAQFVGAAQTDPALADALAKHYVHPRRRLAADRLTGAQRVGQIRAEVDPQVVVDQLWGACYHRLMMPDEPLDTAFADALVDNLLRGIRG